ncbi:hypothetical protein MNV49_004303 [Pseudohyphozyma bogoriensis]|nr:hypothetical protein MNV49_004303 [Pseudohyphozyma bogoriensis]
MKQNKASISYALSTADMNGPRVRFVVHRGFLNERRPSEPTSWSKNPSTDAQDTALTSEVMLVTTDVRGPKATQIRASQQVEIAWWLSVTQHQFRVRSKAWILPSPEHSLANAFPSTTLAPASLPEFDWEQERLRIFRKMSPELRASFCRPIPGTPLKGTGPGGGDVDPNDFPKELPSDLEAKTEEEKKLVKEALENFALIVLKPWEVDMCDLAAQPNERIKWSLDLDDKKGWSEEKVVP